MEKNDNLFSVGWFWGVGVFLLDDGGVLISRK